MQSEFQSGAVIDERPVEEKVKDFKFEEIVASADPVVWTEKPSYRKFPIFNQDGSGSCVAQTTAKMLGIMYWLVQNPQEYVHFSATHVYQRRKNKPSSGMAGVDALDIATRGVTLEDLVPSQNMSDGAMDDVVIADYKEKVGEIFKASNYVTLPTADIDVIASTIQKTKKGVMVWFYFENREWTSKPVVLNPDLVLNAPTTARHSVTAVDYALVDGKKCLIIDDSWGSSFGQAGQRIITEDFFKARNWFSAYLLNFSFQDDVPDVPQVPKYHFANNLRFIDDPSLSASDKQTISAKQSADVVRLQDMLKFEGFFPVNVESTGYYGAVTARAVLQWQIRHAVDSAEELTALKGWFFGAKSISKANQIYA